MESESIKQSKVEYSGGTEVPTGSLVIFCSDYLEKFSNCLIITGLIIKWECFVYESHLYHLVFSIFQCPTLSLVFTCLASAASFP